MLLIEQIVTFLTSYKGWKHSRCITFSMQTTSFLTSYKGWKLTLTAASHVAFLAFLTSYKGWKQGHILNVSQGFPNFSNFL